MQNTGLKNKVKINKKTIVKAIKIASFSNDECPQKFRTVSVNELFFGCARKDRVKIYHFVEWGRIGLAANKRTKAKKNYDKGVDVLIVGCVLEHPSGTCRF